VTKIVIFKDDNSTFIPIIEGRINSQAKTHKKCISSLKKHKNIIYVSIIILLAIINVCQTFLLVGKKNNFPTTFLRFLEADYGGAETKFDKKLGCSVPIEAMLMKRTIRETNEIQFTQEEKIINEYLEDPTNIITENTYNGAAKESMLLGLYFDYPGILEVSAITEDGTSISLQHIEFIEYLDLSSIHYELDQPITIYVTADEKYVTNEFVFRIAIHNVSYR